MAGVCDFKHQVKGTNEAGRGCEFCYYIGYIREEVIDKTNIEITTRTYSVAIDILLGWLKESLKKR